MKFINRVHTEIWFDAEQGPKGHPISVTLVTMNKVYHIIDNKYKNSHNYKGTNRTQVIYSLLSTRELSITIISYFRLDIKSNQDLRNGTSATNFCAIYSGTA